MFRISQYMQELANPTPLGPKRNPPGPVVIWNLIRRCNLTCKHCYSISADKDFPGELSTQEVFGVMDDLKAFHVPVLILSGGEPLLRPDIFDIARRAKEMGFYVGLSTNGTLIDASNIDAIVRSASTMWASVSTASGNPRHLPPHAGRVRCLDAWHSPVSRTRHQGRHPLHPDQDNAHELPLLLQLMEDESIDKFYLSHLELCRARQQEPQGRCGARSHPACHGPAARHCWR